MQEIKCPRCGEVFQVDEAGYAAIVKQVRDREFRQDIERREAEIEASKAREIEFAVGKTASEKDRAIAELKSRLAAMEAKMQMSVSEAETQRRQEVSEKEREILRLRDQLEAGRRQAAADGETAKREKEAALEMLRASYDAELKSAKMRLENAKQEQESAVNQAKLQKDNEIALLRGQIETGRREAELAVKDAVARKEEEVRALSGKLQEERSGAQMKEEQHRREMMERDEIHRRELAMKDEQLEEIRSFKAKQSTKMIGESLEQYCHDEFNKLRPTAFPTAYFEKDNDARSGSKGDFIFRETTEDGIEVVSIMFEMKNEMETTAVKHRNEDFFRELDKDRREKNCEYAVLVSLLEADSDYYNTGIVDVSYRYPKMYVIRPQFFIAMITLLRNAAQNALQYKRQLVIAQNQEIDIKNFEDKMNEFKTGFSRNFELASRQFEDAIKEIDSTIDHLQKVKDSLQRSGNNLRLANNKAQELTIKRLTRGNRTMQERFAQIEEE